MPKKKQGYKARLAESLGMRKGASKKKKQPLKEREAESMGMEKEMGRRPFAAVMTMDIKRKKKAPRRR